MSEYDNNMQVIVSKVVSDKQNAPTLRVSVEIDGVKYKAGLWRWTRKADDSPVLDKNGNPQLKGTLEVDDYRPQQAAPRNEHPSTPKDDDPFGDAIPFS